MILSPEARGAFAIDREPNKLRDRYGRTTFGQSALLARRLIESGVRFITVNYGGWDHHGKIFEGLDKKLPEFDQGLSALIEEMDQRGLFSSTLLVVMGEFGRTPKINKDAGRDHWGTCQSVLVAGGGFTRGNVVGATDKHAAFVTDKYYKVESFGRTLYHLLGIDPDQLLYSTENRPHKLIIEESPLIVEAIA
jgi:uncharacterized protein (DUF1501 family)